MKITPLHLSILIHYHVSPVPWPAPSNTAAQYTQDLLTIGLLQRRKERPEGEAIFELTDRGHAHLIQLLTLPVPEHRWVNHRGDVICDPDTGLALQ